ncbi:MAG: redoxin domain-containing protein [Marinoscillum sp.]
MKQFVPIIILFIIATTLTLASSLLSRSGPPQETSPLSIGDQMPSISSTISINGTSNRESLTDSRDKLIILEFINTHCGTCRKSIPHLESLQQTFQDDLSIILVSRQKDSIVRSATSKYNWSLPIITEDTLLGKLFPYQSVPHQVWIKDKKVIAITDWQYANEANTRKILAGQQVQTHTKQDDTLDFNHIVLPPPLYQSAITPSIQYGSGVYRSSSDLLIYNADAYELFRYAFNRPTYPRGVYVRAEVSDSLRHLLDGPETQVTGHYTADSAYFQWLKNFTFCYHLRFPKVAAVSTAGIQAAMQADLNNFFTTYMGIKGSIQERKIRCLALSQVGAPAFQTREQTAELIVEQEYCKMVNQPIEVFLRQIAYQNHQLGMPVINTTGYNGNIDLEISGSLDNLEKVNQSIQKYGLQFVEQDHEIEVVVLKETSPTN